MIVRSMMDIKQFLRDYTEAIDVGSFKYTKVKDVFDYKTELANTIKAMLSAFDEIK